MRWYAAHAILYVRWKGGDQPNFPIWENIYVIKAADDESAMQIAIKMGRDDEGDSDGTFYWDGRPATWVFAGIRKLIECIGSGQRLASGTEVTYSEFAVKTADELKRLAAGDPVPVDYVE